LGADHGDIGHGYGPSPAEKVRSALRQDSAAGHVRAGLHQPGPGKGGARL